MAVFNAQGLNFTEEYKSFINSECDEAQAKAVPILNTLSKDNGSKGYSDYVVNSGSLNYAPDEPELFEDFGSFMCREGGMNYRWISALLEEEDEEDSPWSSESMQPTNDEDFVSYFARSSGIVDSHAIHQLRHLLMSDTTTQQLHLPPPVVSAHNNNNNTLLNHQFPQHTRIQDEEEEEEELEEEEEEEEENE